MAAKRTTTISDEYSEGIINTVRESLIVLDQDVMVVTANRSFYEFFKATFDNYEVEHEIPIVKRGIER